MDELRRLMHEREEIDRKIRMLTDGVVANDYAKLDTIKFHGAQFGKWAVSFKYSNTAIVGRQGDRQKRHKWNTLYCCDSRKEAIETLPATISFLQDLYDKAVKGTNEP